MLWEGDELARAVGAASSGFAVSGISIDTRTVKPGDLFVALQGARDGHDFVAEALAKGAAGALVSKPMSGNVLVVEDTLAALRRLGAAARARTSARIVAVTGSVGKTTTKEMLRRTLGGFGVVHAAEASFNNHIGVPLTLARMPRDVDFAVFEIGTNHPGEIAPLAALVRPQVAIITCVDRAHLGLMGSEAAIAVEKASIFTALAPGGTAVLPADTVHDAVLRAAVPAGARIVAFGEQGAARLMAVESRAESCAVQAEIGGERVAFSLAAPGAHMARNAVAVLAAASALGLPVAPAAAALDGFAPYAGRGARRDMALPDGARILLLDESYNASGASMRAALAVLALQPGRHVAVLGDMLELGDAAAAEHEGLRPDVLAGADLVFTCGEMMRRLFDTLPAAQRGGHEEAASDLAPLVMEALRQGDAVLVKGSYGSRMRDVIAVLEGRG
ncbi:MAG TPA: UDP-N-acetylmuramoyl-tripeptide--D-alanyl-D-alanine ligase [Acidocella sp.]|jgi:UDP-N-acetylmuramoyl-tripeptide--D-alanyl-D-alanine ligase|nr:UDP-N-acetylmuramoyl-tripeptide--D-alanyl-D-alanine ligase [Acidocella sp.]HVE23457.1 UDP-N-acetylmuramoyl-tripeptide--D-alanyl-D-alanine ligase [Acidocella sp.]